MLRTRIGQGLAAAGVSLRERPHSTVLLAPPRRKQDFDDGVLQAHGARLPHRRSVARRAPATERPPPARTSPSPHVRRSQFDDGGCPHGAKCKWSHKKRVIDEYRAKRAAEKGAGPAPKKAAPKAKGRARDDSPPPSEEKKKRAKPRARFVDDTLTLYRDCNHNDYHEVNCNALQCVTETVMLMISYVRITVMHYTAVIVHCNANRENNYRL
jgi:hypothetical protein